MSYTIGTTAAMPLVIVNHKPCELQAGLARITVTLGARDHTFQLESNAASCLIALSECLQRTLFVSADHKDMDNITALASCSIHVAVVDGVDGVFWHGLASWMASELGTYLFDEICANGECWIAGIRVEFNEFRGWFEAEIA